MIVKEKHTVIDMHPFSQDALLILKKKMKRCVKMFDKDFYGVVLLLLTSMKVVGKKGKRYKYC